MSAALEARRAGVNVVLLEERPALGGQIYKRFGQGFRVADGDRAGHEQRDGGSLIAAVERSGTDVRTGTVVWGIWGKTIAMQSGERDWGTIEADTIIVAAGARDRPVAFPGWTLPGGHDRGCGQVVGGDADAGVARTAHPDGRLWATGARVLSPAARLWCQRRRGP